MFSVAGCPVNCHAQNILRDCPFLFRGAPAEGHHGRLPWGHLQQRRCMRTWSAIISSPPTRIMAGRPPLETGAPAQTVNIESDLGDRSSRMIVKSPATGLVLRDSADATVQSAKPDTSISRSFCRVPGTESFRRAQRPTSSPTGAKANVGPYSSRHSATRLVSRLVVNIVESPSNHLRRNSHIKNVVGLALVEFSPIPILRWAPDFCLSAATRRDTRWNLRCAVRGDAPDGWNDSTSGWGGRSWGSTLRDHVSTIRDVTDTYHDSPHPILSESPQLQNFAGTESFSSCRISDGPAARPVLHLVVNTFDFRASDLYENEVVSI